MEKATNNFISSSSPTNNIPISVLLVMAEYDEKAASYNKSNNINQNEKQQLNWSTFSNPDELNARSKRAKRVTKIGDQRSIVDYINFYVLDEQEAYEADTHTKTEPKAPEKCFKKRKQLFYK